MDVALKNRHFGDAFFFTVLKWQKGVKWQNWSKQLQGSLGHCWDDYCRLKAWWKGQLASLTVNVINNRLCWGEAHALGSTFWCDKGRQVAKENSYSLACLITGYFFHQSAMWYRDGWLLLFFFFFPWGYSLVFLPSWVLVLLVILFLTAGHNLFLRLCFDFFVLILVCGGVVWGVPLALFKYTVLKRFIWELNFLDILLFSSLQYDAKIILYLFWRETKPFSMLQKLVIIKPGMVLNARVVVMNLNVNSDDL